MSVQQPSKELIKQMRQEERLINEIKLALHRVLSERMMSKSQILGCLDLVKNSYMNAKGGK